MICGCTTRYTIQFETIILVYLLTTDNTPTIQRSEYLFCVCPDPNFEFAEPYFGVATGNNCVESTSILHRTTESERGLMVGGLYNYLTMKNKHMNLSFLVIVFSSEIRIRELLMAKSKYEFWK